MAWEASQFYFCRTNYSTSGIWIPCVRLSPQLVIPYFYLLFLLMPSVKNTLMCLCSPSMRVSVSYRFRYFLKNWCTSVRFCFSEKSPVNCMIVLRSMVSSSIYFANFRKSSASFSSTTYFNFSIISSVGISKSELLSLSSASCFCN